MTPNPASSQGERFPSKRLLEARIQELEFIVSHLQKNVDDLNDALLLQQKQLDQLGRRIEQARSMAESVLGSEHSPRTLLDDKPPHY
jgi:uncharacterized coiled-coil protein SlyX